MVRTTPGTDQPSPPTFVEAMSAMSIGVGRSGNFKHGNMTAMTSTAKLLAAVAVAYSAVAFGPVVHAQVLISNFDSFFENELYGSWTATGAVESNPTSYDVTATGYGSNYTYIGAMGILGAGSTHLELDISLSGPAAADGKLGPIITLVDGDNTRYSFAWYGQQLGDHLLTMSVNTPTGIGNLGTIPGFDLDTLTHMHMELDPSSFTSGAYTAQWKNLNLVTAGAGDFDANKVVDGYDFILWQRTSKVGTFVDFAANFGTHYPVGAAAQGVPEPAAAGLALMGGAGLMLRKRRQQSV